MGKQTKITAISAAGSALLASALATAPVRAPAREVGQPSIQTLLDSPQRDLPFNARLAAVTCPVERGPVKEGYDLDRFKVDNTAVSISIATLRSRAKPSSYPKSHRVTKTEFHKYRVTAYLRQYKQESDGDFHLVLKDGAGRSMIAEMPFGGCVLSASRWKTAIANARSVFTHRYSVSTSWHYVNRRVVVTGIGFMDVLHGQTGVAPNGVELHPVTAISFP